MEWVVSGSGLRKSMKSGGSWLFQKSIFCAETAFRDKMFWQCPIWEKFFPPALEVFFSKKTFYKLHNLSFHYFFPKRLYLVITIHGIIPPEQCVCVCGGRGWIWWNLQNFFWSCQFSWNEWRDKCIWVWENKVE